MWIGSSILKESLVQIQYMRVLRHTTYFVSIIEVLLSFGVYLQLIILPVIESIASTRSDCTPNKVTSAFTCQVLSWRIVSTISKGAKLCLKNSFAMRTTLSESISVKSTPTYAVCYGRLYYIRHPLGSFWSKLGNLRTILDSITVRWQRDNCEIVLYDLRHNFLI